MSGGQQNKKQLLIGDLVEVPEIRTVIQLQDLADVGLRRLILESFVITGEVLHNLQAIFTSFCEDRGRGVFLKGHFGSGKSHFLSMLSLLLREPRSWQALVAQEPSLDRYARNLAGRRYLVAEVSLVEHRSSEFLEDILLRAIFRELSPMAGRSFEEAETRQQTFGQIQLALKDPGLAGMVLLIDELSEFLRSKPDARAYNEDIRFLQYLGEQAAAFPLWIIASLQEWIEETGEIQQETFSKIKDRYRIRLSLGRAHIEELVSQRLIRHREGAESAIADIFGGLRAHFDTFPVPADRFARLYPVHPATITLLDRLKTLFSEHRGVVDFIHYRLKGDPERHIPSLLQRPAHELLTPEVIFDHFLDRIRERSESQVYVERVYSAFEDEIGEIFQDADQQQIGLAAVKLLILLAISPVKMRYSVRRLAEMVLHRVTPLEAEINYQFFNDILARLASQGSYIRVEKAADPLENHYFIDLKADVAGIVRRRIRQLASEIFAEDGRLFTRLAPMVDSAHLPLPGWVEHGRQQLRTDWDHSSRGGLLLLLQLDDLRAAEIEALASQWRRSEDDFFLLVGTTLACDRQYRHVRDNLLPLIRSRYPGMFLFWLPRAPEKELPWLKEMLAAVLLLEKTEREQGETSQPARLYLKDFLDKQKRELTELFERCYFKGVLLEDERQVELASFGYLSQKKFLEEFVRPLLLRRFPRYSRIQPYMAIPAPHLLSGLLRDFFTAGMLQVDDHSKFASRNVLEGVLKPMGLVRKKANQYLLQVDPRRNELARCLLEEMGPRQTVPLEELYWSFRKGDYGLLRPQFEILLLALFFSGHLLAYQGARRKPLEDLARSGLRRVTAVGRGEILSEELRRTLVDHPLIPERFRRVVLTLASQEELWSEIKAGRARELENLQTLLSRIQWAASFQAFKNLPWQQCRQEIEAIVSQWEEVKVSLPCRDGLERFLKAGQREPLLTEKLVTAREVEAFLAQAERALFVYQYLTDPRLQLPATEEYAELEQQHQEMLQFYQHPASAVSATALTDLLRKFQVFQEHYTRAYVEAHQRARSGGQFEPYEKLTRSRRYVLLQRLDRLEMVSVRHNRRSIDQALAAVLNRRCLQAPQDHLRGQPACSCGFRLGESASLKPLRRFEREIDLGIFETLEALRAPPIQEKLLPYLEGLDLVGKKQQAAAIRKILEIPPDASAGFFEGLDEALTSEVIQGINEAFRGKVVVVQRDLDELYQSLVHRKYTLAQTREILRSWLKEETISEDTFVHFLGAAEKSTSGGEAEELTGFIAEQGPQLLPLLRQVGPGVFAQAMLASLWASHYRLAAADLLELFPFLAQGDADDTRRRLDDLAEQARMLRRHKPELFDATVRRAEEDSAFIQSLWARLAPRAPAEVFNTERVFPAVLREAFERLLGAAAGKGGLPEADRLEKEGIDVSRALQERRQQMLLTLQKYHLLSQKAGALKKPKSSGAEPFRRWETTYIQAMSPLPYLLQSLQADLPRLGVAVPPFLRKEEKEIQRALADLSKDFARFYRKALPGWIAGAKPRPLMIQDIPFLLSRKRKLPDHSRHYYLLMDGMRWDLWEKIRQDFFGRRGDQFRLVRHGALWARQPTTTSAQLCHLEDALAAAYPQQPAGELLWKVSTIDERIHTEKGSLEHLFANVIRYLELELLYRLQDLPSRTLLILFSDHGFAENPAFSPADKYAAERYTHGKDSPFEVVVPWAWVLRL